MDYHGWDVQETPVGLRLERENVVLWQGDCREILPAIESASVDSFVTDLPYGMDLQPQREKTTAIANDTRRDAKVLWWSVIQNASRIARPDTAHLFFSRWSEVWAKDVLEHWFTVKGGVVWKKNNFGLGYYIRPQWELAWFR